MGYPSHCEALPGVDLKEAQSGRSPACHPDRVQAESKCGSWELAAKGPTPPREASAFSGSPASIEQWTQAPFELQSRAWPRSAGMGSPSGREVGLPPSATGISVQRGVRADRGGPGLGLSTVLLPPAGVAQLWAGERMGYRGWRQAQGAPLAGGKEREVSREAAQDGGDCHSEPRHGGRGVSVPFLPSAAGGHRKEAPGKGATEASKVLPFTVQSPGRTRQSRPV